MQVETAYVRPGRQQFARRQAKHVVEGVSEVRRTSEARIHGGTSEVSKFEVQQRSTEHPRPHPISAETCPRFQAKQVQEPRDGQPGFHGERARGEWRIRLLLQSLHRCENAHICGVIAPDPLRGQGRLRRIRYRNGHRASRRLVRCAPSARSPGDRRIRTRRNGSGTYPVTLGRCFYATVSRVALLSSRDHLCECIFCRSDHRLMVCAATSSSTSAELDPAALPFGGQLRAHHVVGHVLAVTTARQHRH